MKRSSDKQRLFHDMQEHPEGYSDEQLEAMMADLDSEPDTDEAWKRFETRVAQRKGSRTFKLFFTSLPIVYKIAAIIVLSAFLGGLSFAGYHLVSSAKKRGTTETPIMERKAIVPDSVATPDTIIRFANVRLDSILTIVSSHYGNHIVFRDTTVRALRLYTTWKSTQSLTEFAETLNEFDGLKLVQKNDTLIVESDENEEERK